MVGGFVHLFQRSFGNPRRGLEGFPLHRGEIFRRQSLVVTPLTRDVPTATLNSVPFDVVLAAREVDTEHTSAYPMTKSRSDF